MPNKTIDRNPEAVGSKPFKRSWQAKRRRAQCFLNGIGQCMIVERIDKPA